MSESSKTRTGRVLQVPTPEDDAAITAAAQGDPDAMSFTDAEWAQVKPLARRGRPLGSGTKTQITLRLDADLVSARCPYRTTSHHRSRPSSCWEAWRTPAPCRFSPYHPIARLMMGVMMDVG